MTEFLWDAPFMALAAVLTWLVMRMRVKAVCRERDRVAQELNGLRSMAVRLGVGRWGHGWSDGLPVFEFIEKGATAIKRR